jgi:hypothetical protein
MRALLLTRWIAESPVIEKLSINWRHRRLFG